MKYLYLATILLLAACGSNSTSSEAPAADTTAAKPAAPRPSGPPEKVAGTFKGMLPCTGCSGTEAILTIESGDTYSYTRLFRGMKTRGANISNQTGNCVFENGVIKLLAEGRAGHLFRIVSEDTIRALDTAGAPLKGKTDWLLVRSRR